MVDIDYDSEIQKAELIRIQAETARIHIEKEKLDEERKELVFLRSKKWWQIKASGFLQATIAGVVAGALLAGFGLDHFLKISDLNSKSLQALKIEKEEIEAEKIALEEENRQTITFLRNENNKLEAKVEFSLEKIELLSSNNELAESQLTLDMLEAELNRLKLVTESTEKSLSTNFISLVKKHKATSISANKTWFPVISSPYNKDDLLLKLEGIRSISPKYQIHVYSTTDGYGTPVYAITLGGYLSKSDALERVSYARSIGIASDAYAWSSSTWGDDILEKIE